MNPGQEVATRSPAQELVAQVRSDRFQEQIALALPSHVPARRFVRATVTALMQNPDLARANPDSLFQSVIRCAQDGLLPDGREAVLLVFNTKDGPKAQYLPMIGGYRKIAAEHGWTIRSAVVYEKDDFDFELGLTPKLVHVPVRPGAERGKMIAAYAVGTHKEHPPEFEVMSAADIEKVRQTSRSKDKGPWVDWEERMWEKTTGKRLFAKLPLGERDQARIARVIHVDELEPGQATDLLYGPGNGHSVRVIEETPAEAPEEASGEAASDADGPQAGSEVAPADETDFHTPDSERSSLAEEATAAGLVVFDGGRYGPKSGNPGLTIMQVYEKGDVGEAYLRHSLKNWKTEPVKSALAIFAKVYLPSGEES